MLGFENRTSTPTSDGVGWTRAKLLKRARHRFALHCMHSEAADGAAERPPRCQREIVQCQKPCCPWNVMRGAAAMLTVAGRALGRSTAITLSSATFSAPSHGRRSTLSVADPVLVQYPMGQNQSVPQPVAPETKPATSACYSASQKLPPEPRAKLNSARSKIGDINNPVTYGGRCAAVWLRRTTLD